jgi:hypothetical protein
MAPSTFWHTIETTGSAAVDQLKHLIDEGNIRRVRIRQQDQVIAEFPLTVGVVGAVLAPPLAAIGAVVALITECTIEVEKTTPPAPPQTPDGPPQV